MEGSEIGVICSRAIVPFLDLHLAFLCSFALAYWCKSNCTSIIFSFFLREWEPVYSFCCNTGWQWKMCYCAVVTIYPVRIHEFVTLDFSWKLISDLNFAVLTEQACSIYSVIECVALFLVNWAIKVNHSLSLNGSCWVIFCLFFMHRKIMSNYPTAELSSVQ